MKTPVLNQSAMQDKILGTITHEMYPEATKGYGRLKRFREWHSQLTELHSECTTPFRTLQKNRHGKSLYCGSDLLCKLQIMEDQWCHFCSRAWKREYLQEPELKINSMIRNDFATCYCAFGTNTIRLLNKLQAKNHYKDFQY